MGGWWELSLELKDTHEPQAWDAAADEGSCAMPRNLITTALRPAPNFRFNSLRMLPWILIH